MKNGRKIFLDDIRNPEYCYPDPSNWIVVRNFQQFKQEVLENGLPDIVSFDHDIDSWEMEGVEVVEKTGMDCAKWLVNWMMDCNTLEGVKFNVHSQNPTGAENILKFLEDWNKKIKNNFFLR